MFVLENVSLGDSGMYECTSLDTETFESTVGETPVSVNCKHIGLTKMFDPREQLFSSRCFIAVSAFFLLLCVDLGSAVVTPGSPIVVAQGGLVAADCSAQSSLQTQTAWFKVKFTHRAIIHTNRNNILSQNYTMIDLHTRKPCRVQTGTVQKPVARTRTDYVTFWPF